MGEKHEKSPKEELKAAGERASKETYVLRLYVAGITPRSQEAIRTVKSICEEHLAGRYDLEVIDIYQQPDSARQEDIVAAPTLIKKLPAPLRQVIGSMVDREKLLVGLNLVPQSKKINRKRSERRDERQ